jgi:hypothetical protein
LDFIGGSIMRTAAILSIVVSLAAPAVLAAGSPFCAGDGPQSVLACYSAAYAARDSAAIAALYAPDYASTDLRAPGAADFDYQTSVTIAAHMFHAKDIAGMTLTFGAPGAIEPGAKTMTWVLRDVPCTLRLDGTSIAGRPGPWVVEEVVSLWVRRMAAPAPHFVIYREELRAPEKK